MYISSRVAAPHYSRSTILVSNVSSHLPVVPAGKHRETLPAPGALAAAHAHAVYCISRMDVPGARTVRLTRPAPAVRLVQLVAAALLLGGIVWSLDNSHRTSSMMAQVLKKVCRNWWTATPAGPLPVPVGTASPLRSLVARGQMCQRSEPAATLSEQAPSHWIRYTTGLLRSPSAHACGGQCLGTSISCSSADLAL